MAKRIDSRKKPLEIDTLLRYLADANRTILCIGLSRRIATIHIEDSFVL